MLYLRKGRFTWDIIVCMVLDASHIESEEGVLTTVHFQSTNTVTSQSRRENFAGVFGEKRTWESLKRVLETTETMLDWYDWYQIILLYQQSSAVLPLRKKVCKIKRKSANVRFFLEEVNGWPNRTERRKSTMSTVVELLLVTFTRFTFSTQRLLVYEQYLWARQCLDKVEWINTD